MRQIRLAQDFAKIAERMKDSGCIIARDLLIAYNDGLDSVREDAVDYVSVSEDENNMISYLTDDRRQRLLEEGEHLWSSDKRFKIRASRIIRKIFKDSHVEEFYKDSDIERFNNLYVSNRGAKDYEFIVVSGSSICTNYDGEYYSEGSGSLQSSCMRNNPEFMRLYADNPESVEMLVMKDSDGNVSGRALLWKEAKCTKTFNDSVLEVGAKYKVMDRIYYTKDSQIESFKDWAKENGYLVKDRQSYDYYTTFNTPQGEYVEAYFEISMPEIDQRYYPYIDTFFYVDSGNCLLHNNEGEHYDFEARATDGTPNGVRCYHTGDYIDRDDAIYIESLDDYVHQDHAVCIGDTWYYSEDDDIAWSDVYSDYLYTPDCTRDYNGEWVIDEDARELYNGESAYYEECVKLHDGTYALETDEDIVTTYSGERALIEDTVGMGADGDCIFLREETIVHKVTDLVGYYADDYSVSETRADGDYVRVVESHYKLCAITGKLGHKSVMSSLIDGTYIQTKLIGSATGYDSNMNFHSLQVPSYTTIDGLSAVYKSTSTMETRLIKGINAIMDDYSQIEEDYRVRIDRLRKTLQVLEAEREDFRTERLNKKLVQLRVKFIKSLSN
jgi:hypothetical protein